MLSSTPIFEEKRIREEKKETSTQLTTQLYLQVIYLWWYGSSLRQATISVFKAKTDLDVI